MGVLKDITGQRFGRLTVIQRTFDHNIKTRNAIWLCKCDCGKITSVVGTCLRSGDSRSCGCFAVEIQKKKKLTDEQRKQLSESKKSHYNGLNGYGHVKKQNRGYQITFVPCHPHANKDGYVMLHTVLMERKLGRYLSDDEVVHHINHNREDNRIENLQLMGKKEHMSMHMKERHAKRRNKL